MSAGQWLVGSAFGLVALVLAYTTGYDRGRWKVERDYSERETCPCPECVGRAAYEGRRSGGPR